MKEDGIGGVSKRLEDSRRLSEVTALRRYINQLEQGYSDNNYRIVTIWLIG
jgi:hypothetical protein